MINWARDLVTEALLPPGGNIPKLLAKAPRKTQPEAVTLKLNKFRMTQLGRKPY